MGGRTLHRPYEATLDAPESEEIGETKRVAP
jgi:hypothetical protein